MSAWKTVLNNRNKVKNGKSPLPLEVLRAFQAERLKRGERIQTAVENGLLRVIKDGGKI